MIPVSEPDIGEEEISYVVDCLRTGMISGSGGEYIQKFEDMFSSYCGRRFGITTTSGTTALHLAIAALGIGKGDEVIMPPLTNMATAFAIVYTGATPVLVDSEPETWNMDVTKIEEKVTGRSRAILPVHIYGHPCDMDPILDIASGHGLSVVEDAAEAHGATYKGIKAGGIGDIGCFSFYANKIITTGEGGMVVTDDSDVADRARDLRNLAYSKERRFLHESVGFNYRMTNLQAAIGVAQMARIDDVVARRRRLAALYNSRLREVGGIVLPPEKPWAESVYWMYAILIGDEFGMNRDELMSALRERGIDTRTFFIPANQQPALREMALFAGEECPVADDLSRRGLYLPTSSKLTDEQVSFVCDTIEELAAS